MRSAGIISSGLNRRLSSGLVSETNKIMPSAPLPFCLAWAKRSGGAWQTAATTMRLTELGQECRGGSNCHLGQLELQQI